MKRFLLACAFLFGIFASAPSHATILWAGGEDVDAQLIGSVVTNTSSSFYRSGYARLALENGQALASDPPSNRIITPQFANQSLIWIHAEATRGGNLNTSNVMNAIVGLDSGGIQRIMVKGTNTAGVVQLAKENLAGSYTTLATCLSGAWPAASLHKLDLFINYSVSGEITFYVDGTQVCDFVGDVTTDGNTSLGQVYFGAEGSNGNEDYWSEMIVSTTDTRNMNLVTLSPVANGNTMAWSGAVGNVNGTNYNDTAALTTGTSSLIAEFTTGTLPAGSFTIPAVIQSARVEIGTSGPQHFSYIVRPGTGATDYSSSNVAPTTAFANYQNIWTQNPGTSAGWTFADMSGIQYGIESQP